MEGQYLLTADVYRKAGAVLAQYVDPAGYLLPVPSVGTVVPVPTPVFAGVFTPDAGLPTPVYPAPVVPVVPASTSTVTQLAFVRFDRLQTLAAAQVPYI